MKEYSNLRLHGGFLLVEAILGLTLVGAGLVFNAEYNQRQEYKNEAELLGRSVADVASAFDRRVVIDGYVVDGYDWNYSINNTHDVVSKVLNEELIAFNNPDCGSSSGWRPATASNDELALIPCLLFNSDRMPLNFSMESERNATPDDDEVFANWSITLYHANSVHFDRHIRYYSTIVRAAQLRKSVDISGATSFKLINRQTGNEILSSECLTLSTDCGIRVEHVAATGNDQVYLRQDGSNQMFSGVTFRLSNSSSGGVMCTRDFVEGGMVKSEHVACGLELDREEDASTVNASFGGINLSDLLFSRQVYGGTPVPARCSGSDNEVKACGFTMIGSGTPILEGYLNNLYVTDSIKAGSAEIGGITANTAEIGNLSVKADDVSVSGQFTADRVVAKKGNSEFLMITSDGAIVNTDLQVVNSIFAGNKVITKELEAGASRFTGAITQSGGNSSFANEVAVVGSLSSASHVAAPFALFDEVRFNSNKTINAGCSSQGALSKTSSGRAVVCGSNSKWQLVGSQPNFSGISASSHHGSHTYTNGSGKPQVGIAHGGVRSGVNGCQISVTVNGSHWGDQINNGTNMYRNCIVAGIPIPIGGVVRVTSSPYNCGSNCGSFNFRVSTLN
ncbi:hypothetical protein VCHA53O466_50101 [Vibrio chagasii]|nr:hypothetical protein VCHA53O466_50101 [Vibrio chagasii]